MWRIRQHGTSGSFPAAAFVAVWLCIGPAVGLAEPGNSYHRPCTAGDLVGTWKVVKFRALGTVDKQNQSNSYFHPHQRYQFAADGALKSMTSTRPIDGTAIGVFDRVPHVISYRFRSEAQLETTRTDLPGHRELWICHFVTRRVKDAAREVDLRKGDVVMTLLDGRGKALYIRQMRRVAR